VVFPQPGRPVNHMTHAIIDKKWSLE